MSSMNITTTRNMQPTKENLSDFRDWIEFTLEMLVDSDDGIKISIVDNVDDTGTVCVMVSGKRDEIGKIIGKSGLTIDAIRRVAYSIARRIGISHLELIVNGATPEVSRVNGT